MVSSTFVREVVGHGITCLLLLIQMSPVSVPGEVEKRSSVPIIYTLERDMFPEEWRTDPISAQAAPLSPTERERSSRILRFAMRKYPTAILNACLERVYVVAELRLYGVPVGGASSKNRVYIVDGGIGYTDAFLEEIFHHEVAHVLLRRFPAKLNGTEWKNLNPAGFQYRGSGLEAARREKSFRQEIDSTYLSDGFLNAYALSQWEEDFCVFAQKLFAGKRFFWQIVERYERVKRKTAMVMEFYRAIDPTFTEDYFRRFVKETPGRTGWTIYADA